MPKENTIGEDIAVIKNQITNLADSFKEFKTENKTFCTAITRQADDTENIAIKNGERISNMAVFQGALTAIVGAVATYLGVKQ